MPCFIVSLSASLAPDAALSCELYTLIEIKKRLPTPSPRADDAEEVLLYRADGKYLRCVHARSNHTEAALPAEGGGSASARTVIMRAGASGATRLRALGYPERLFLRYLRNVPEGSAVRARGLRRERTAATFTLQESCFHVCVDLMWASPRCRVALGIEGHVRGDQVL